MSARPVHWHEGMFLRPHHLQAAQRHVAQLVAAGDSWDHTYNWGLREFELDPDGLANHRFVVRKMRLRLHDGTLLSVPEDGELPALDLQPVMGRDASPTIYLGVPVMHLGRPNVAGPGVDGGRFLLDSLNLEDENTGQTPQPIQLRRLNLQLLTPGQDQAGYEVLPLARLEKSAGADGTPRLHLPYIPPILACDAWQPLLEDIIHPVYDRIGRKIELLSSQILSRGIALDTQAAGDALLVGQLRSLNEAYAHWGVLAFARGVHPLTAYAELARLIGQLSIYDDRRRPPELPRYDHDDLGTCFYAIKRYIDGLLDKIIEPGFEQRPFEGVGKRMQVGLEPKWLEPIYQMFVGVKSPLAPEECVKLLTDSRSRGALDMKIGSSENVEKAYMLGQAGLRFAYTSTPPTTLPKMAGLIFFQLNRDSEEWTHVKRTLSVAIRINENVVNGNIAGQRVLSVKRQTGQPTPLEFSLYVIKQ
jgi:type VI secretion system protein ImpJ